MFGLTPDQLLGKPTIHMPINMIVQDMLDDHYIGIWQCKAEVAKALMFGSKKTHQLILGDAFIRPKLVCDSDAFKGAGFSSIACSGFAQIEKWEPIFHRE